MMYKYVKQLQVYRDLLSTHPLFCSGGKLEECVDVLAYLATFDGRCSDAFLIAAIGRSDKDMRRVIDALVENGIVEVSESGIVSSVENWTGNLGGILRFENDGTPVLDPRMYRL